MKRLSFTLIVILLISIIITLVGYNELVIRQESKKYQEIRSKVTESEPVVTSNKTNIYCIGDNFTLGSNNSAYPTLLSSQMDCLVTKFGGDYDQTIDLSIRMGQTKVYVNKVTIPATATPVNVTLYDDNGKKLDVLKSSGSNFSSVKINDISGILKYDSKQKKHTFTRDEEGQEVKVTKLTQITSEVPEFQKDSIAIIFTGTYDPYYQNSIFKTYSYQQDILKALDTDKYIIVSLTSKRTFTIVDDMNKVLKEKYGDHFLDFRTYLLENGLKDADITPTEQDKKDLVKHYIPSSLLNSNQITGNSKFNELLVHQLIQKMIELKYIDEKQL